MLNTYFNRVWYIRTSYTFVTSFCSGVNYTFIFGTSFSKIFSHSPSNSSRLIMQLDYVMPASAWNMGE